jgi:hypothetical protein
MALGHCVYNFLQHPIRFEGVGKMVSILQVRVFFSVFWVNFQFAIAIL